MVMGKVKFIKTADVKPWLAELAKAHRVLAPVQDGDAVVFRPFAAEQELVLDRQATMPPKKSVFPQSEHLVDFTSSKDPENLGRVQIEAREVLPEGTTVVFGCRACDARGFTMFDRVYLGGKTPDIYYKTRRDNTCFITQACRTTESTCFCNWVGSHPADSTGSDVLATPLADGYLLEAVSERGDKLLGSGLLADGEGRRSEAEQVHQTAAASLAQAPDIARAPEKLLAVFDNLPFWEEMSAKCISCGACTYLCPTCYCFNITDETSGLAGSRIRSWDNCMSAQFTMEASGHNPRPTKAHRLRNRVGHKFSYYPSLHGGVISCCGCGRCIKSCPVGIDIREIVLQAVSYKPAAVEE